jgi:hypothetical protein
LSSFRIERSSAHADGRQPPQSLDLGPVVGEVAVAGEDIPGCAPPVGPMKPSCMGHQQEVADLGDGRDVASHPHM